MRRFLAVEPIPLTLTPDEVRARFRDLARHAHALGIRPVETFYSLREGESFTLFEAEHADDVRRAHELAGWAALRIAPAERLYPDLLDEPRRAR